MIRGILDEAIAERARMVERIQLLEKCCSERDQHLIRLCAKSGDQQKRIAELEAECAHLQSVDEAARGLGAGLHAAKERIAELARECEAERKERLYYRDCADTKNKQVARLVYAAKAIRDLDPTLEAPAALDAAKRLATAALATTCAYCPTAAPLAPCDLCGRACCPDCLIRVVTGTGIGCDPLDICLDCEDELARAKRKAKL